MKIYSHRSDKDVDHLRFDMKMGGVVLNFRRSGEEQTMNLKKSAEDHYGDWMASNAIGEYL